MIALLAFLWWVVVPLSAVSWGVAVAGMLSVEPRLHIIVPAAVAPTLLMLALLGILVAACPA